MSMPAAWGLDRFPTLIHRYLFLLLFGVLRFAFHVYWVVVFGPRAA
jgi:hypothetical protein